MRPSADHTQTASLYAHADDCSPTAGRRRRPDRRLVLRGVRSRCQRGDRARPQHGDHGPGAGRAQRRHRHSGDRIREAPALRRTATRACRHDGDGGHRGALLSRSRGRALGSDAQRVVRRDRRRPLRHGARGPRRDRMPVSELRPTPTSRRGHATSSSSSRSSTRRSGNRSGSTSAATSRGSRRAACASAVAGAVHPGCGRRPRRPDGRHVPRTCDALSLADREIMELFGRARARSCTATRTSGTSSSTVIAPDSSTGPWSARRRGCATLRTRCATRCRRSVRVAIEHEIVDHYCERLAARA